MNLFVDQLLCFVEVGLTYLSSILMKVIMLRGIMNCNKYVGKSNVMMEIIPLV